MIDPSLSPDTYCTPFCDVNPGGADHACPEGAACESMAESISLGDEILGLCR
jgi:hypothetical protein